MSPELLAARKLIAKEMAEELSQETGIPVSCILGRERDPQVVVVRQELWLRLHKRGISMSALGEVLQRDHTSIRAGLIKAQMRENESSPRPRVRVL